MPGIADLLKVIQIKTDFSGRKFTLVETTKFDDTSHYMKHPFANLMERIRFGPNLQKSYEKDLKKRVLQSLRVPL